MPTPLFIASDHAGLSLKITIAEHLAAQGWEIKDVGTHTSASCDYPDFAHAVCTRVLENEAFGILICGTGIGMSMAANKVSGIRAALCGDCFSAEFTRRHNDANILTLGARVVGPGLALKIINTFLDTPFEGGRHARRIAKLADIESRN